MSKLLFKYFVNTRLLYILAKMYSIDYRLYISTCSNLSPHRSLPVLTYKLFSRQYNSIFIDDTVNTEALRGDIRLAYALWTLFQMPAPSRIRRSVDRSTGSISNMANTAGSPTPTELPGIYNTDVVSANSQMPWATSTVDQVANREEQFVVRSNQEPWAQGDVHTLIPIAEDHPSRICLHNLRHVAKYHGYDVERLYPEVFTSASPSPLHTPIAEASQPSHQRIIPRAEDQAFPDNYTLIPITKHYPAANAVQESRICLQNLRHVAKYHGYDIERLHPEVFASVSPGA